MQTPLPVVFLVGPTAVGKTAAAVLLAQHLNAEIVSCDAMQVYREVPVATSQPPEGMRRAVPHHLLGIISIEEEFDVARYSRLADDAIQDILGRGKVPLVVGGSGLYLQVLLDGIFAGPGRDEEVRRNLAERIAQEGTAPLYEELCRLDPEAAKKIHPHDERRLVRALEICRTTGGRFSEVKKVRAGLWGRQAILLYALNRERVQLYERIHQRVDEMFAQGLVEKIARVLKLNVSSTARALIGLKEVSGYLAGEYPLERAEYLLKRNTRHYAKRQLTWFRREERLKWFTVGDNDSPAEIAERIWQDFSGAGVPGTER